MVPKLSSPNSATNPACEGNGEEILEPTGIPLHLGFLWDTLRMTITLPEDKTTRMEAWAKKLFAIKKTTQESLDCSVGTETMFYLLEKLEGLIAYFALYIGPRYKSKTIETEVTLIIFEIIPSKLSLCHIASSD